ncbi:MAG: dihydroorotase [Actinomycetota bacterium]
MSNLLIKNGRVVDPSQKLDKKADILIKDGLVAEIGANLTAGARDKIYDAKDKVVTPGLIDMHAHLREPGREDEETVATGTRAAAAGGFTSVNCMPNTEPVVDNASVVRMLRDRAEDTGLVNVFVTGAITKGLEGREISDMGDMVKFGAVAFSDDGHCVMDAEVMRRAMEYVKMLGVPLIVHAEDMNLSRGGQMHEGYYSTLLGLSPIPPQAEEVIVARDIRLAALTGSRVHLTHISTKGSVEMVKIAKLHHIPVTCDVTPHHLTLTDKSVIGYDTNFKINPPLRSEADVKACVKGLAEGTVDAIATDHAPHAVQEKECEWEYAANGAIGLETTLAVLLTKLVDTEKLSLKDLVAKLSCNPAVILGLDKTGRGTLKPGAAADITIIDTRKVWTLDSMKLKSKSRNTTYNGWELKGRAEDVIVGGKIVKI